MSYREVKTTRNPAAGGVKLPANGKLGKGNVAHLGRYPARLHQKLGRNLPRFADPVNHLDRQGPPAIEQFRCTRPGAEQIGKFSLRMSELFDGVIQQVDRIGDVDIRSSTVLIFFNKRCENVELITVVGAGRGADRTGKNF